jgi:hypothetical protein
MTEEEIKQSLLQTFKKNLTDFSITNTEQYENFLYKYYLPYQIENVKMGRQLLLYIGTLTTALSGLVMSSFSKLLSEKEPFMIAGLVGMFLTMFISLYTFVFLNQKDTNTTEYGFKLVQDGRTRLDNILNTMKEKILSISPSLSVDALKITLNDIWISGEKKWMETTKIMNTKPTLDRSTDLIIVLLSISLIFVFSGITRLAFIWVGTMLVIPCLSYFVLQANNHPKITQK